MVDPAFLRFFETVFPKRLDYVEIPGLPDASWDRKAAYLLWRVENGKTPPKPPAAPLAIDYDPDIDELL